MKPMFLILTSILILSLIGIVGMQESFAENLPSHKSEFVVGNVTSKISSGQNLQEKMASVPRCENTSDKFPNSALTSEQKIIKSYYQSDLVVMGQVINKTSHTSNEKNWDIIHVEIQDILSPYKIFKNEITNPVIIVSTKCWSYSDNLENEWSFDVYDNVFLYLNRIHDIRFTISNPIKDTSVDSNVMSIPTPLFQNHLIKNGMWNNGWDDVYCKPSLVSITKPNTEFACVTLETKIKLIERNYEYDASFIKKCTTINGTWNYEFNNCVDVKSKQTEYSCEDMGGITSCMSNEQKQSLRDICILVCEFD